MTEREFWDDPELEFAAVGKVLFDTWKDEIKKINIMMLEDRRNTDCNCAASILIKEIQMRLTLMLEAEKSMAEAEGEQISKGE